MKSMWTSYKHGRDMLLVVSWSPGNGHEVIVCHNGKSVTLWSVTLGR
jgi:hypothetical protein